MDNTNNKLPPLQFTSLTPMDKAINGQLLAQILMKDSFPNKSVTEICKLHKITQERFERTFK